MRIALDATYSTGENLTGVGVYSREILWGMAEKHPEAQYLFCYRPHRYLRSFTSFLPRQARRCVLFDSVRWPATLFHGVNQRLPKTRYRRMVTTFHDLFVLTGEYSTPAFRERFARQAWDAAARSDLIISVSQFTADQVAGLLRVERSRLRVIPHGVHVPAKHDPFAKKGSRIVLHVGALQKRKNIVRLVKAFESMESDWHLILAGAEGFGAAEIRQVIENSPRRGQIHLPGYVTQQQLEDLYSKATVLAFPSLDEGFGIPVLEAMAWGVPVITSNRSALPEVVGDAAILVDPSDAEEIAFALRALGENEGLRRMLIERGLGRASHFTWGKAIEATWSVYQELAA